MLEALYRLYQEAFWASMQQRDQTYLRRNDTTKLVRDIQQPFASGDRESARLLSKQLESEHIATLQALQRDSPGKVRFHLEQIVTEFFLPQ